MTADVLVAIPAYDEPDIVSTVQNLLNAAHTTIHVVVILQDDDPTVEHQLTDLGADVHAMQTRQARGCGWARALAVSLWNDEPWYYQCDAHMTFEPGWDAHFIEQAERLPRPGVLSSHPLDTSATDPDLTTVTDIFEITDWGFACGAKNMTVWGNHPLPARALSGANQFMSSCIIQKVPLDPHIMFWGEESGMSLRFWTHGYDLWHPGGRTVVRHKYMHPRRVNEDQYWTRQPKATSQNERSYARTDALFGRREENLGVYGLGLARTREDWQSFAKVDLHAGGNVMPDELWRKTL